MDARTETGAPPVAGRYSTARVPEVHPATETLRARYEAYRMRQARDLLALVPSEGVRGLYRHLVETSGPVPEGEAVEALVRHCASLLPLPPFAVWLRDFHEHRAEHLLETPLTEGPAAPDGEPVGVELRGFEGENGEWVAGLWVQPVMEGWRGSIRFHRPGDPGGPRTGDVFREAHLTTLRERFRALDDRTLAAFLRSALP